MNLPNIITLSRIPMMVLVVWLMNCSGVRMAKAEEGAWFIDVTNNSWVGAATAAFLIFLLGAFGDWLDGYLARRQKMVSLFGKFMDALSDKIFVLGIMIAFVELQWVSIYFILIIVCREFLISGMRMIAAAKGVVVAAERGGKVKTAVQMTAMAILLLVPVMVKDLYVWTACDKLLVWAEYVHWIGWGLFFISVYLTFRSGLDYIVKYRKMIFEEGV